jgi:inhibitor of KinA
VSDGSVPSLSWASERALRVDLAPSGDAFSEAAHRRVRAAFEGLRAARLPGLVDVTPAYGTLLLTFDAATLDPEAAEAAVREFVGVVDEVSPTATRLVEIPVCYEGDLAPDLEEVARRHGIAAAEVVALHASAEYVVRFLGFSPGFAYLAGLPAEIATPRRAEPRVRARPGSVGIAGSQTGVYPQATPGGWQLIGCTPRPMFDLRREPPALLALGDRVRFVPIPRARFDAWREGA